MNMKPSRERARLRAAQLLALELGWPLARILNGAPFAQFDARFDSLMLMEVLLLLEREFGAVIDMPRGTWVATDEVTIDDVLTWAADSQVVGHPAVLAAPDAPARALCAAAGK